MKRRKEILVDTEEQKKIVYDLFDSFKSKNEAHKYFKISDNKQGSEYIKHIANIVGFDFSKYKKPKQFCLNCGKELENKGQTKFCSMSCSARFNNKNRVLSEETKHKISESLKKTVKNNIDTEIKEKIHRKKREKNIKEKKKCILCGKDILSRHNKCFCSAECQHRFKHLESYKDFINNNEKYCNGGYTPKAYKDLFLEEQNNKCAICSCEPYHNGKPLIFILDHIDGNAANNKRDNLRLVCPNCDSQLDTYKSKNKNSTRRNYWKEKIMKDKNLH